MVIDLHAVLWPQSLQPVQHHHKRAVHQCQRTAVHCRSIFQMDSCGIAQSPCLCRVIDFSVFLGTIGKGATVGKMVLAVYCQGVVIGSAFQPVAHLIVLICYDAGVRQQRFAQRRQVKSHGVNVRVQILNGRPTGEQNANVVFLPATAQKHLFQRFLPVQAGQADQFSRLLQPVQQRIQIGQTPKMIRNLPQNVLSFAVARNDAEPAHVAKHAIPICAGKRRIVFRCGIAPGNNFAVRPQCKDGIVQRAAVPLHIVLAEGKSVSRRQQQTMSKPKHAAVMIHGAPFNLPAVRRELRGAAPFQLCGRDVLPAVRIPFLRKQQRHTEKPQHFHQKMVVVRVWPHHRRHLLQKTRMFQHGFAENRLHLPEKQRIAVQKRRQQRKRFIRANPHLQNAPGMRPAKARFQFRNVLRHVRRRNRFHPMQKLCQHFFCVFFFSRQRICRQQRLPVCHTVELPYIFLVAHFVVCPVHWVAHKQGLCTRAGQDVLPT